MGDWAPIKESQSLPPDAPCRLAICAAFHRPLYGCCSPHSRFLRLSNSIMTLPHRFGDKPSEKGLRSETSMRVEIRLIQPTLMTE